MNTTPVRSRHGQCSRAPSFVALLLTVIITAAAAPAMAADLDPESRQEATRIIADMRRIVTPGGIERLETVAIGGIPQWVSIRSMDPDNPVLLMLHGGPGFVSMPTSWYFQRGWEEYFTVVQWDQRGAGKTYLENDPEQVGPTLTLERMVADTEEMVAWLRTEFGQDRIFVLGHSWGSYLGLMLARRKPEWLHAYIGMGQGTDSPESERRGWRFAMQRAQETGHEQAIAELQSIAPYAEVGVPVSPEALGIQRKWLNHFGGAVHGRTGFSAEAAAIMLAPEYTDADVAAVWEANAFSERRLLSQVLALDLSEHTRFECPLILFLGRHDYNVSSQLAAEWFARVDAPVKKLVWFEHSAHEIMNEQPGKTLVSLVNHALPLAGRSAGADSGGRPATTE